MIKYILSVAATIVCQTLFAQQQDSRNVVCQSIAWAAVNSNIKISKRLVWQLDGQLRQVGSLDPQQYQARTSLDVRLGDHLSVVPLGYVYTWNYLYGKQPMRFQNNEHRVWQQVLYSHHIGTVKIDHRLRFEQRFLQRHYIDESGATIYDGYSDIQYRLRYRLSAKIPIGKKRIESHTYFGSIYDEIFASRGEYVTYHKPDQNRIFAGLGYQFNTSLMVQAGFLYQRLIKRGGAQQENNYGMQVQLVYNFDLTTSH